MIVKASWADRRLRLFLYVWQPLGSGKIGGSDSREVVSSILHARIEISCIHVSFVLQWILVKLCDWSPQWVWSDNTCLMSAATCRHVSLVTCITWQVHHLSLCDMLRICEGSRSVARRVPRRRTNQGPPLSRQTSEGVAHVVVASMDLVDKVGGGRDFQFLFPLDQWHGVLCSFWISWWGWLGSFHWHYHTRNHNSDWDLGCQCTELFPVTAALTANMLDWTLSHTSHNLVSCNTIVSNHASGDIPTVSTIARCCCCNKLNLRSFVRSGAEWRASERVHECMWCWSYGVWSRGSSPHATQLTIYHRNMLLNQRRKQNYFIYNTFFITS